MSDKIDYDFKLTTPTEYELGFIMFCTQKLFNHILQKSKEALDKKHGVIVPLGDPNLNKVEIPDRFYNLIKTILKKKIKQVSKAIKKDKIELLSVMVSHAVFNKIKDDWKIKITITGDYIDKR